MKIQPAVSWAKEYIAINEYLTVADAVKVIQDKAEEVDQFYNVWVVDNESKLVGIMSLKRLILALKNPDTLLRML